MQISRIPEKAISTRSQVLRQAHFARVPFSAQGQFILWLHDRLIALIDSLLANAHTAYAMTFRKKFSIGALIFLLTVPLALLIFPEKPEPNWEGRKLSEWVQVAGKYRSLSTEFEEVVQALGTNGIPFYTKWMRYEPGLL